MIRKVPGGFKVVAKGSGKPLSKKPLTEAGAKAQLAAVEISKAKRKGK